MIYITALVSILLGSFAQYFLKIGMNTINLEKEFLSIIKEVMTSAYLLTGVFCYGLSLVFWLIVLSKMELSRAYPMVSLGYVFTLILGYFLLNESISFGKLAGIICIVMGVVLIAKS